MNAAGDIKDISHELRKRIVKNYLDILQETEANLKGAYADAIAGTVLSLKERSEQCAKSLSEISDVLTNYAKDLLEADQQIAELIE